MWYQEARWQKALSCPRCRDNPKLSICYPYLGRSVANVAARRYTRSIYVVLPVGTHDKLIINFRPMPLIIPSCLRGRHSIVTTVKRAYKGRFLINVSFN